MPTRLSPEEMLDVLIAEVGPSGDAKMTQDMLFIRHSLRSPWEPVGPVEDAEDAARILDVFLHG